MIQVWLLDTDVLVANLSLKIMDPALWMTDVHALVYSDGVVALDPDSACQRWTSKLCSLYLHPVNMNIANYNKMTWMKPKLPSNLNTKQGEVYQSYKFN